jgi:dienelactone hydrolase
VFPDSFGSRELGAQCTVREPRLRVSRERAADLVAARRWLQQQPWVVASRIMLLGWSSGASGLLWGVRPLAAPHDGQPDFRSAIAFYPNCRRPARFGWSARVPTLVLIGGADDWSSAKDCQQMIDGARGRSALARIVVYPGAYQDFDRKNLPVRERSGVRTSADGSGHVHVGTNIAARTDAEKRVAEWLAQ